MSKIAVIDDDLASDLLAQNLRQRGHDCERLSSVDDALRNLDRLAASDLVILDLIMPRSGTATADSVDGARSTGMEVFRALRRRNPNLPILVFTANQDSSLVDIIGSDHHARYVSRWSGPKLSEFVDIVHEMLGVTHQGQSPKPFIVHGHDDKTKLEVKNYLQNTLQLPEPIILHEQPSQGRTVIEKFEKFSAGADIVFVLLTPDDRVVGASAGNVDKRRARQNVILELGFFLGALGRLSGRVFLLYKGPLEIPSDLSGVIYIDITSGVEAAGETIRRELRPLVESAASIGD